MKAILFLISLLISFSSLANVPSSYTKAEFKSVKGGSWEDVNTWQVSYDGGGFNLATEVPGASGHAQISVEILCEHAVEIKSATDKLTKVFTLEKLTVRGVLNLTNQGNQPTTEFKTVGNFTLLIDNGAVVVADKLTLKFPANAIISIVNATGDASCRGSYNLGFNGNCKGNGNTGILIGSISYSCNQFTVINQNGGTAIGALAGANPGIVCFYDNTTIPEIIVGYMNYTGTGTVNYTLSLGSPIVEALIPSGSDFRTDYYEVGTISSTAPQATESLGQVLDMAGNYKFKLVVSVTDGAVTKSNTGYITITKGDETVFDGQWDIDKPEPTLFNGLSAHIKSDYDTSSLDSFNACSCKVDAGSTLTIRKDKYVRLLGSLENSGKVFVEDGGNFLQVYDKITNTGNITVENTFTLSTGRQQYNYVISPVKGQALKTIYDGIPFVIYHNENTNFFYNAGNGDYVAGKGFAVKEPTLDDYPAHTTTITGKYEGVPFNGILNYPIAYTTDKVNVSHGWNLIGNPYPSSLDLIEFYNKGGNKDKIESTFKFWDNRNNLNITQEGSNYGGSNYALFNVDTGTSGTGTSIGSSIATERKPTRYVKPGIAFIVRAKSTANGATLHFDNSYRSVDAAPDFHGKQNAEQDDRFWLNLTSPTGITVTNAVVYFPRGNNDYASDDSDYQNLSDDIYTIVGNNKLAIQGKASFEDNDVLPLGINTFKAGSYTISLNEKEGKFANGQAIYLKDKQLNIVTNLSEGAYTFETAAGEHTGRFEIVYLPTTTLGTQTAVKSGLVLYKDGGDFVLKNTDTMNKLDVYDMSGRMIHSAKPQAKEFRLNTNTMNSGVYILQVQTPSGIQTKRVIK
ncbi:T9SS type A sorting domain-containing protein [Chryseobacterium sp. HSC-36S06]|uniref:T9SS type A sorting domain-containing protein n=1 Tax=Chryseobacterium sp. HSC-36S06 TaxID=2910970 RepID=UPI0020A1EC40|nr:T9SS type A sorting domain-containing protein [Chryseobacterium sp. HSC-36S06]MCP2037696.1 hypothetical protein [Chryseobacterium sp. HSC-36S06]